MFSRTRDSVRANTSIDPGRAASRAVRNQDPDAVDTTEASQWFAFEGIMKSLYRSVAKIAWAIDHVSILEAIIIEETPQEDA